MAEANPEIAHEVAIFACSHRSGGNSDAAAERIARGVREAGGQARIYSLRDYNVTACLACRSCGRDAQSRCVLRAKDQAEELFGVLLAAPAVVFASPIYFYALPSLAKTWIDRAQRFWEARRKREAWIMALPERPAFACLVAGQPSGSKLFEGARLCLKYFLANFGLVLEEPLGLRGLDEAGDLPADAKAEAAALDLGRRAWEAAKGAADKGDGRA